VDTVKPVLIIDDDEAILGTLELALSWEGYPVLKASDGAAALDLVQRQSPGLILLDMKMPVMDGWAFARAYEQEPGPRAPIVVVTAARDAAQRAAEIGAEGYLAKPFDMDDLLDMVARFLAKDPVPSVPNA
jgi:two-component system, chemotaxis family, chemotaxis protein CheY